MRRSRGALALGALAMVAACGGGGDAVGELVAVFTQQASIDGNAAGSGTALDAGAVLGTDDTGSARFRLRSPTVDCHLLSDSTVQVLPSEGVALELRSGEVVCDQPDGSARSFIEVPGSSIELAGATVVVEYRQDQTVVQNLRGMVGIDPDNSPPVSLSPLQETSMSPQGSPASPRPINPARLTPVQREAALDLQAGIFSDSESVPVTTTTTTVARDPRLTFPTEPGRDPQGTVGPISPPRPGGE